MENLENNKMIAEFMGIVFHDDEDQYYSEDGFYIGNTLEYNSSWDWLMPVVEKIEGLKGVVDIHRHWGANVEDEVEDLYFCIIKTVDGTEIDIAWEDEKKIDAVYKAIVEFIKWHKKQLK